MTPDTSRRLSSGEELRLFVGLALQPFVAAGLAFVSFPLVDYTGRPLYGGFPVDPVASAISFSFGVGIVALVVTVCGALPTVLYLLKRGRLSLKKVLVGGAALGNAPFVLLVAGILISHIVRGTMSPDVGQLWYGFRGAVRATAISSYLGVGSAAVFWLVAGRSIGAGSESGAAVQDVGGCI